MFNVSTLTGPNHPDRILGPVADCFTQEVAVRILAVGLEPDIQDRVNELAEKANEGQLTAERGEYELLIEKSDLLGILKSLARQVLAK